MYTQALPPLVVLATRDRQLAARIPFSICSTLDDHHGSSQLITLREVVSSHSFSLQVSVLANRGRALVGVMYSLARLSKG